MLEKNTLTADSSSPLVCYVCSKDSLLVFFEVVCVCVSVLGSVCFNCYQESVKIFVKCLNLQQCCGSGKQENKYTFSQDTDDLSLSVLTLLLGERADLYTDTVWVSGSREEIPGLLAGAEGLH